MPKLAQIHASEKQVVHPSPPPTHPPFYYQALNPYDCYGHLPAGDQVWLKCGALPGCMASCF